MRDLARRSRPPLPAVALVTIRRASALVAAFLHAGLIGAEASAVRPLTSGCGPGRPPLARPFVALPSLQAGKAGVVQAMAMLGSETVSVLAAKAARRRHCR